MKHLIMADLEGANGVERISQTRHVEPFKHPAMRMLTQEVNACIQGIYDADKEAEILVIDRHSPAVLPQELDPRVQYAMWGKAKSLIRPSYDGISTYLYVGQHAMAGMLHAPISHTDSLDVVYKRFNGVFVGEFGVEALRAGNHGVRVVFAAGDDKLIAEARALVPCIRTVVTKWGEGWQRARHRDHDETCHLIRAKAAEAVENYQAIEPLRAQPPYSHEIRFVHPRDFSQKHIEGVRITQLDERTVLFRFDDLDRLQVCDF